MKNNKIKGFTLIETLLVIGAIALFGITTYMIFNKVKSNSIISQESKRLYLLKDGVNKYAQNKPSYAGITNTVLANTHSVPTIMQDSTDPTKFISVLTGLDITVSSFNYGTAVSNGIRINYVGVNKDDCAKFVTSNNPEFQQISINGTVVKNYSAADNSLNLTLTSSNCNAMATSSINFDYISTIKNANNFGTGTASAITIVTPTPTPAVIAPHAVPTDIQALITVI